jgi:hypothetical protein
MTPSARGAASSCQRRFLSVCGASVLGLVVALLLFFGTLGEGVQAIFGAVPLLYSASPSLGIKPPTALVLPPTPSRCNRLHLPGDLANTTAVPYYPAAVKHPVTGEWLMFFTYQEVDTLKNTIYAVRNVLYDGILFIVGRHTYCRVILLPSWLCTSDWCSRFRTVHCKIALICK